MKKLNDKIWGDDKKLNPSIRKRLQKIANDFMKFVDAKGIKIIDVTLTGSMANYNWHSKSDIDLHIIYDPSNFKQYESFIKEFMQTKKALWNATHDILFYGHEVEIYPEPVGSNPEPNGLYSITSDKWIIEPVEVDDSVVDEKYVNKLYENEVDKILAFEKESKSKKVKVDELIKMIEIYLEKLKNKRNHGIKTRGEMSVENLVFKKLRKNQFLDKLYDIKVKVYDDNLTLERKEDIVTEIKNGDTYIVNKKNKVTRGNVGDRYKVLISKQNESVIRNMRIRKDYSCNSIKLKELVDKNIISKEVKNG